MADQPLPDHVPEIFKRFFWDVQFETLSPKEKPYYVINRLLDKGDLEAARWVVKTFPKKIIIKSLMGDESLSPMTATFFARYYEQPYSDFACYKNRLTFKRPPSNLWPFTENN